MNFAKPLSALIFASMFLLISCSPEDNFENKSGIIGKDSSQLIKKFGKPIKIENRDTPLLNPKTNTLEQIKAYKNKTIKFSYHFSNGLVVDFNVYKKAINCRKE